MAPEHKPDLDKPEERKAAAKTAKALKKSFSSIKTPSDAARAMDRLESSDSRMEGEMPKLEKEPEAQAETIEQMLLLRSRRRRERSLPRIKRASP